MRDIFRNKNVLKDYIQLTKPGIVGGNAITVVAGFLLASKGQTDWFFLLTTLAGISFVVASGCVFNNYIDRDIDALMNRTKKRALVEGRISPRSALVYATALGFLGSSVLFFYTNFLTVSVALFGLFVYVVVYSMWLKRTSVHGTLVGSVAGAVPPVAGYLAVSNSIDLSAVILFLILVLWQMVHSYAIAIYRLEDYTNAKIPVLPVKKGVFVTKVHMLVYVVLFVAATFILPVSGNVGDTYFFMMIFLNLAWLWLCMKGFATHDDRQWAKTMYRYSIVIISIFCAGFMVGHF